LEHQRHRVDVCFSTHYFNYFFLEILSTVSIVEYWQTGPTAGSHRAANNAGAEVCICPVAGNQKEIRRNHAPVYLQRFYYSVYRYIAGLASG